MAIGSWILIANGILLILGTTTFVSLWLGLLTQLPFQDRIISALCHRLTQQTNGLTFQFKSARANYKNGCITLEGVVVKRQTDLQYTCFDLCIDRLDFTLDFMSLANHTGLLTSVSVSGVRGTVDRRHLDFGDVDPSTWLSRRSPSPDSDFNLTSFRVEDLFLTIHDINGFRPYTVLVHRGELPRLRTQWLLYDLLSGDIVGEYDGSLFSLSRIRVLSAAVDALKHSSSFDVNSSLKPSTTPASASSLDDFQISKFRISNLNIDMLNSSSPGAFGLISSGTVDIDMILSQQKKNVSTAAPTSGLGSDDGVLMKVVADEFEEVKAEFRQKILDRQHLLKLKMEQLSKAEWDALLSSNKLSNSENPLKDISADSTVTIPKAVVPAEEKPPSVDFFIDIRFNHVRASMPSWSPGMSDILTRSVVAYLNSQPTSPRYRKSSTPPLSVHLAILLSQFDGSWTLYQCGFMDMVSRALSDALIERVTTTFTQYSVKGLRKPNGSPASSGSSAEHGAGLLYKFGWWGVQSATKGLLTFWDWASARDYSTDDDRFTEVFDEMVKNY